MKSYLFFVTFIFFLSLNPLNAREKPKIAVVTMAIGDKYYDNVKIGIENKASYCAKHGYEFFVLRESLDSKRPIPWSKILFLEEIIKLDKFDWVFWTDADSLIMNFNIRLEELIQKADSEHYILMTKDFNDLNSGQFLIKVSDWSLKYLETIYSYVEFTNHPWWENAAIIKDYQTCLETRNKFKILPQRTMNSYYAPFYGVNDESVNFQNGDFIIHFPAIRADLRRFMEEFSTKVLQ